MTLIRTSLHRRSILHINIKHDKLLGANEQRLDLLSQFYLTYCGTLTVRLFTIPYLIPYAPAYNRQPEHSHLCVYRCI